MRRRFGPEGAELVKSVLADIVAANNIHDVCEHPITPTGPFGEQIELNFEGGLKVAVEANQRKNAHKVDGTVDWQLIRRIKILSVELDGGI